MVETTVSMGEYLRLKRERAGLKLLETAQEAGCDVRTLSDIERGRATLESIEAAIDRLAALKSQENREAVAA